MRSPHPLCRHRSNSNAIGMTLFTALAIAGGIWFHAAPSRACIPSSEQYALETWGIRSPWSLVLVVPGVVFASSLAWAGRFHSCDR